MKLIGFLGQNRQEAENLLPVMRKLNELPDYSVCFISLDDFFRQECEVLVGRAGYQIVQVRPVKKLKAPFYLLSSFEKAFVLLQNRKRLRDCSRGLDGIVCCTDGALERVFINEVQSRGGIAFMVMSGFILNEPSSGWIQLAKRSFQIAGLSEFFYSEVGEGKCNIIFAPGQDAGDQLVRRGIPLERILITGVPRFADLARQVKDHQNKSITIEGQKEISGIEFLYLMGAWGWHANDRGWRAECRNLEVLQNVIDKFPNSIALTVRVHPRSKEEEISFVKSLQNASISYANAPLQASMLKADIVGAIFSTGLLEAIALKKIPLILDLTHYLQNDVREKLVSYGLIVIDSVDGLHQFLRQLLSSRELGNMISRNASAAFFHFIHADTVDSIDVITRTILREFEKT
jgi:hypothetical protein